ncbi:MAG: hypothetical protein JST17_09550 [Bacteroidetes bacterium]|nr:hypothetical protein [Bacteroidota bacterium]MBS1931114.1 hypothetical protein [Bacteroidota bacterium]
MKFSWTPEEAVNATLLAGLMKGMKNMFNGASKLMVMFTNLFMIKIQGVVWFASL